jgi:hypothetical protein
MAAYETIQQYIVFDARKLLDGKFDHQPLTPDIIDRAFRDLLGRRGIVLPDGTFTIDSVPHVKFHRTSERVARPPFTPQAVFGISSPNAEAARCVREAVLAAIVPDGPLISIGVDPTINMAQTVVQTASEGASFGTLAAARQLTRADQLPPALNGNSVNVVVIDTGFDQSIVPPGQFCGGWQPLADGTNVPSPPPPGMTRGPTGLHGMMVVESILAHAPAARIFDVPMIPPVNVTHNYISLIRAQATYQAMLADISFFRANGIFPGPWILMNAWAIYDRRSEGPFVGEYTENLGPGGVPPHSFIALIEQAALSNFDIVFSAGNCGEFCPDGRCGPNDYGPGRSIWGANAHKDVLTLGAVGLDTAWQGFSSEGPGPTPNLDALKPDICAPAQFEGTEQYPPGTGTSTSAAVAAGVVCALRTRWNQTTVSPAKLKMILNATAMRPSGPIWNECLGFGILDAFGAYQSLDAAYP